MREELRIIVSGGGTGGHIFPAVSIANAIKSQHPEAEILFVGAEGGWRCSVFRLPVILSRHCDLRFRPQAFAEEYCRAFQDLEKPENGRGRLSVISGRWRPWEWEDMPVVPR